MARYSRSSAMREFPAGPLAGKVSDVVPNTLRHANITLMHELGIDDRTNKRYHSHRQSDVQGAHYIRRYDMQLLKAARAVAAACDEASEFAMTMVLDWDIDTSIFERNGNFFGNFVQRRGVHSGDLGGSAKEETAGQRLVPHAQKAF